MRHLMVLFTWRVTLIKPHLEEKPTVGIADGERVNWDFLERHTQYQVLDFFHTTEYFAEASHAMCPIDTSLRNIWLELA